MRLEQLKYFVAVAEMHSMALASNLLHVTHQNISKAIIQLEAELGTELLNRSRQGITLTEKGAEIYRYSKQMLAMEQKIYEATTPLEVSQEEKKVFHFLLALAFYNIFSTVGNRFADQHRSFQYFPEYKEPTYVNQKLLQGHTKAQMVLTMMEDEIFEQNREKLEETFDIYILSQEPLMLITGNLVQALKLHMITLPELQQIPLAFYRESLECENFFLNCLKQHGFLRDNISISGSSEFCGEALDNGTAATIGTAFSYINSFVPRRIRNIKMIVIEPPIQIDHMIFVRKDASNLVAQLAQFFKEVYLKS